MYITIYIALVLSLFNSEKEDLMPCCRSDVFSLTGTDESGHKIRLLSFQGINSCTKQVAIRERVFFLFLLN